MRVLADMVKSDAAWNYALIEIVVNQVLAVAAYNGVRFKNRSEISVAVHNLDGYPILNRVDGASVQDHAVRRIAWLIGLPPEQ